MNCDLPNIKFLVSVGVVKVRTTKPKPRKRTEADREYTKLWWRRNYEPTGKKPGRPSVTGLSVKKLGSPAAYQRALYRLRKGNSL